MAKSLDQLRTETPVLLARLRHLLASDFIASFDAVDPRTHSYTRDIKEADSVSVQQGQWVDYMPILGAGDLLTRCSVFGLTHDAKTPFCPNCGARMDGGAEK